MADDNHLTPDEVEALLRFVEDYDPIVIGGQSINIWAEVFRGENLELDALSPLTSKDIDFLHNLEAERALQHSLKEGELRIPSMDDNTPEAAVVTGYLGDKKVTVDFLGSVLGVDTDTVRKRSLKISHPERPSVTITLMHPLDCVRSRLSNINTLHRTDEHSITQAAASLIILDCYIESELSAGTKDALGRANKAILDVETIVRNFHRGKTSQTRFGDALDPAVLVRKYANDERIDVRVRKHQILPMLARLGG